jgi:4'-phosphopantetheinyl transferase
MSGRAGQGDDETLPAPFTCDHPIPGVVDVRAADLHVLSADCARYHGMLSADEQARAGRFHFAVHRNRYIAGRGWLRELLGGLLGRKAQDLVFCYGEHGKPELEPDGEPRLYFNVAHDEDMLVCAVTDAGRVGIDIERVSLPPEADDIARSHFSAREARAFGVLSGPLRALAFTRCWTRKEAIVKAIGDGLAFPLRDFDVTLDDDARLLRLGGTTAPTHWTLAEVGALDGFVVSLAVEAAPVTIRIA